MNLTRYSDGTLKGWTYFLLFSVLWLSTCTVNAQTSSGERNQTIIKKEWEDSMKGIEIPKRPIYIGGEISFSGTKSTLTSNLEKLDGIHYNFIGGNLAGTLGSERGKLKLSGGVYHSGDQVPYEVNMLQSSVTGNLYLLRINKVKYHILEPYSIIGLTYQHAKYYGHNLVPGESEGGKINYSTSRAPFAGSTSQTMLTYGLGLEYQLKNPWDKYIHFFTEVSMGTVLYQSSSNSHFKGTQSTNPVSISFGVNLGIIK